METSGSSTEIALLIDYNSNFYRTIVSGVARFSKARGWRFFTTRGVPQMTVEQLRDWQGAGVIGRLEPDVISLLKEKCIPSVNIKSDYLNMPVASVLMDNDRIGRDAAEYLYAKGIRRFAGTAWSIKGHSGNLKLRGFLNAIEEHGIEPVVLESRSDIESISKRIPLEKGQPVGVFAAEDFLGRMVIEASLDAGLSVPEDVAVLGVDNSPFICDMLSPTMSSIELGAERVGYQAAVVLDQLLSGVDVPLEPILVAPERIEERRSTDILQMQDELVARALRFIQENAGEPIVVLDIVDALHCNRRVLEIRFREKTGRTLHEEIRRARIQRACKLLRETDMLVEAIAEACGYSSRERFNASFRREMDKTPSVYRREYRFSRNR
ncbi:MAG: substrate-binding domain-containing protein [Puniceicoccaceae bacterium]